jgi:hypothetical protein
MYLRGEIIGLLLTASRIQLIRGTVSSDRFNTTIPNLHINDNSQTPEDNTDKFYNVMQMASVLTGHYPRLYSGNETAEY